MNPGKSSGPDGLGEPKDLGDRSCRPGALAARPELDCGVSKRAMAEAAGATKAPRGVRTSALWPSGIDPSMMRPSTVNERSGLRNVDLNLSHIIDQRIILITGKGGVGRTSIALSLAMAAAKAGKRVLLADVGESLDGYSPLGPPLGLEIKVAKPRAARPGLDVVRLWSRTGHEQFLRSVTPSQMLVSAALRSKSLRKFLDAAPSFQEMGVFYHLLHFLRMKNPDGAYTHELIIVDMPATGHTLALTRLPEVLLNLVPRGPVARALREGQAFMYDRRKASAWVVTLPETLPVTEALELIDGLRETRVTVGGVVLNRLPTDPFTPEERAALSTLLANESVFGALDFNRVAVCRREVERLASHLDVPLLMVPHYPLGGRALIGEMASALEDVPKWQAA